jgi:hypothetical protein
MKRKWLMCVMFFSLLLVTANFAAASEILNGEWTLRWDNRLDGQVKAEDSKLFLLTSRHGRFIGNDLKTGSEVFLSGETSAYQNQALVHFYYSAGDFFAACSGRRTHAKRFMGAWFSINAMSGDFELVKTSATGKNNTSKQHLTCKNKDNAEKDCCCFLGSHTYLFSPRNVDYFVATLDTGKRFNCQSKVKLEVKKQNRWVTVKQINAVSSKGNSEKNRITVRVDVNSNIDGVRLSDGCVCCIDYSDITLY